MLGLQSQTHPLYAKTAALARFACVLHYFASSWQRVRQQVLYKTPTQSKEGKVRSTASNTPFLCQDCSSHPFSLVLSYSFSYCQRVRQPVLYKTTTQSKESKVGSTATNTPSLHQDFSLDLFFSFVPCYVPLEWQGVRHQVLKTNTHTQ